MKILLTKYEFNSKCLKRDSYKCVVCKEHATEVHHILERKLFKTPSEQGGFFIDNGVSLCNDCHVKAENTTFSPAFLRQKANIKEIVLPKHFDTKFTYDKWGNILHDDGTFSEGELFNDDGFQKILKLNSFLYNKIKY